MAQTVIEAGTGKPRHLSDEKIKNVPRKAVSSEYNLTSLSIFNTCLLTVVFAALAWISIAYILVR